MKSVGIRELKNRLSDYLRLVQHGEVISVTNRGTVVAELRPPRPPLAEDDVNWEGLRRKCVRFPTMPNDPALYRRLPSVTPPGTAQMLIDEDRGER